MMDCLCKIFREVPIFEFDEGGNNLDSKLILDFTKAMSTYKKESTDLSGKWNCFVLKVK